MKILASPYRAFSEVNPTQARLYDSIEKHGAHVSEFSMRKLFWESWDVWHLHWPVESILVRRKGSRFLRLFAFWIGLRVARFKKIKIFWTAHNLRPHERDHPLLERMTWRALLANIDGIICMSDVAKTELLAEHPQCSSISIHTIPHGHYRGAYPDVMTRDEARAALGASADEFVGVFIGQIRPYKGVVQLVRCFVDARVTNSKLFVAGVANDSLRRELESAAVLSSNVRLHFGFVDRNDIQKYLRAADLVILPYTEILNSGSAILALSFDRPILVPARGALSELRSVVGPDWVSLYEGQLNPEIVRAAVQWAKARQAQPNTPAPLDALSWERIGRLTIQAFS
jgi:glycosyltransferase involved in cell wall biosynthesis